MTPFEEEAFMNNEFPIYTAVWLTLFSGLKYNISPGFKSFLLTIVPSLIWSVEILGNSNENTER